MTWSSEVAFCEELYTFIFFVCLFLYVFVSGFLCLFVCLSVCLYMSVCHCVAVSVCVVTWSRQYVVLPIKPRVRAIDTMSSWAAACSWAASWWLPQGSAVVSRMSWWQRDLLSWCQIGRWSRLQVPLQAQVWSPDVFIG